MNLFTKLFYRTQILLHIHRHQPAVNNLLKGNVRCLTPLSLFHYWKVKSEMEELGLKPGAVLKGFRGTVMS